MWRSFQRSLVIALVGAVVGVAANAVRWDTDKQGHPGRIPLVTPPQASLGDSDIITLQEARELWETGAVVFFDARAASDYEAGHIGLALSLPVDAFEEHYTKIAGMLTPDSKVVVYCDGRECDLSHRLAKRLHELGYKDVRILVNGWTVWRAAGLATTRGAQP